MTPSNEMSMYHHVVSELTDDWMCIDWNGDPNYFDLEGFAGAALGYDHKYFFSITGLCSQLALDSRITWLNCNADTTTASDNLKYIQSNVLTYMMLSDPNNYLKRSAPTDVSDLYPVSRGYMASGLLPTTAYVR